MELFFINENFENQSMPIDDFQSLTWTERWNEPGSFTLYVLSRHVNDALKARYVYNTDAKKAGVIEKIDYENEKSGNIKIQGRTLESLLEKREINDIYRPTGNTVEEKVMNAVNRYGIAGGRNLDNMVLGDVIGYPDTGDVTSERGQTLSEFVYKALKPYAMSPDVIYDYLENTLKLQIKKSVDRSVDNAEHNSPVLFSRSFENVKNEKYQYDDTNLANTAYVVMEDDPCYVTVTQIVSTQQEGQKRVEIYVKSSASSEPDSQGNPTVALSACKTTMREEGKEALFGRDVAENVSGDLFEKSVYEYRKDFFVGDKVSLSFSELGVNFDLPITEVTEVYEKGYKKTNIQIGEEFSSVNLLKKIIKNYKLRRE